MKHIKDSQKVTMTVRQLTRLVKESVRDSADSHEPTGFSETMGTSSTLQVVNEMARIGFIKDNPELEVYVNTDDGGALPHFHVRDRATRGGEFHCCIRFDAPMYFPHEGKRSTMNAKQRKALVELLKSVDRDSGKTLWWESLHEWNRNNSDVTVDLSTPMPDYQHLRMPEVVRRSKRT